ncbi:hypothetical protein SAPIS_v1c03010 [Spiroplasma apis B31]|uniref:Transmembrane protein n=2 Tax=Spiroplasma apis TaxID=2137 RepID=V5RHJ4_SPIAP|nr:hypothetical protein SAPIS_v1c03010 [Spiroplasma apis B31]
MDMISRMERNKQIHDQVNKEIAYNIQIHNEKSIISATFEKLKQIDVNYFKEKLDIFDKKHQIEKPYLDKDRSTSLISEDLKYEIRKDMHDLKQIKSKETPANNMPNSDIEEQIELRNEKFIRYFNSLKKNEEIFTINIDKLKQKQQLNKRVEQEISMATVQKVRSQDTRSTMQMLSEVSDKTEKAQALLMKDWKMYEKKYRFKGVLIFIIMAIIIMIVSIITPYFL